MAASRLVVAVRPYVGRTDWGQRDMKGERMVGDRTRTPARTRQNVNEKYCFLSSQINFRGGSATFVNGWIDSSLGRRGATAPQSSSKSCAAYCGLRHMSYVSYIARTNRGTIASGSLVRRHADTATERGGRRRTHYSSLHILSGHRA